MPELVTKESNCIQVEKLISVLPKYVQCLL